MRVNADHIANDGFDGTGIEVIRLRIVISWRGDNDKLGVLIGFDFVQRGPQIKRLVG